MSKSEASQTELSPMTPTKPTAGASKPLTDPNRVYRAARAIAHGLIYSFARVRVEGRENFPARGPYLLVINHLHLLDVPTVFTVVPHQVAVIAYEGWANHKVAGGTMRAVTKVIPINPQKLDHRSLTEAMDWLREGGVIGIAPEGKRSKSGELLAGQPGTAYLASRTGVPIVPVVAWGQERAFGELKNLRRAEVFVRVGRPFVLPGTPSRARTPELMEHTRTIMRVLAEMLPESYRGAYREVEGLEDGGRAVGEVVVGETEEGPAEVDGFGAAARERALQADLAEGS